ncbi:lysylphosphatidylglycerol synthase transmembrane domain-containing protein [Candidatus Magnetaquicoccus inordinatus]|uniref:lysylphosphatidylglycerol synthase transmembrane domain-containing protein n=1 Tax=Candidatus Magnetaquicoccus inordinatus TaxID=2496818 RepID=UPI00187D2D0F|nr:lysylphosphatidylglycerol synthase transmembrane domain-containing protein [Candidatus Magnetaquicoccus inordinatus]
MVSTAWRPRLLAIGKATVAAGMIYLLWQQGILDPTLLQNFTWQPQLLLVVLACNLAMISLGAVRWQILLRSQAIIFPFAWSHAMTYLTFCFNLLVPGSVGGDALRMAYLLRHSSAQQKSAAILTILADRVSGLYAMFLLALLAALANLSTVLAQLPGRILLLSLLLTVVGAPLLAALFFWGMKRLPLSAANSSENSTARPLSRPTLLLTQLGQAAHSFWQHKRSLLAAIMVSVLAQSLEIIALIWIARHLGLLSSTGDHFFLAAPIAWIANLLPVSPGGLGVGEAAFAQICQWLQPDSAVNALGTPFLINRVLQMLASLPGLWVYLNYRPPTSS